MVWGLSILDVGQFLHILYLLYHLLVKSGKTKNSQIICSSRIYTTQSFKSQLSSLLALSWKPVGSKAGEYCIEAAVGPADCWKHASVFDNVIPQLPWSYLCYYIKVSLSPRPLLGIWGGNLRVQRTDERITLKCV